MSAAQRHHTMPTTRQKCFTSVCVFFARVFAALPSGTAASAVVAPDQLVRPNRAHLFLRVAVHNGRTGNLSILHVLDLIGDVPVAGGVPREPRSEYTKR